MYFFGLPVVGNWALHTHGKKELLDIFTDRDNMVIGKRALPIDLGLVPFYLFTEYHHQR